MRPPLLSDESIHNAIRELAADGERVTGVAVRKLLAARYGARGGVARIYRLVHEAQRSPRGSVVSRVGGRAATDETREAAIARGDLATIRKHLRVLEDVRGAGDVHRALANAALLSLPAKNRGALRKLLGKR